MVHIRGHGVKDLVKFVIECLRAGGIPQVVPKYGGVELWSEKEGAPSVLVRCWGAGQVVKGGIITNLPEDLIKKSEATKGDWKWILEQYAGITNPVEFRNKLLTMPESEFEKVLNEILARIGGTSATPATPTYAPF